jgi:hypothetical protein
VGTRLTILLALFVGLVFSQTDRNLKIHIPKDSIPENMFFPTQIEHDSIKVGLNSLENSWYSQIFDTLKEPKICHNDTLTAFRLLLAHTRRSPVSIRLQEYQSKVSLTIRICSGNLSFISGPLQMDTTFNIDISKYIAYKKLLKRKNYWNMNTYSGNSVKDGSKWILEASTPRHYHVVDMWSAKQSDRAFYKCCRYLIKLSGMRVSVRIRPKE